MRYRHRAFTFVIVVLVGSLASGCGEFHRMIAVKALRNGISNKFHVEDVQVSRAENDLDIRLTNSGYEDLAEDARFAQAQLVAEFARDNYGDIAAVDRILIMMVKKFALRGEYSFDKNAKIRLVPNLNNRPPPASPKVNTKTDHNETTVSASALLLYGQQSADGTTRNGMLMLPHFAVSETSAAVPRSVDLDLAAYSSDALYQANHTFRLVADGQVLAEGNARFVSSGTITDGQVAEFMTVTLPYKTFKKLAESRSVILTIGTSEIDLLPEHLNVLREMTLRAESRQAESSGGTRP